MTIRSWPYASGAPVGGAWLRTSISHEARASWPGASPGCRRLLQPGGPTEQAEDRSCILVALARCRPAEPEAAPRSRNPSQCPKLRPACRQPAGDDSAASSSSWSPRLSLIGVSVTAASVGAGSPAVARWRAPDERLPASSPADDASESLTVVQHSTLVPEPMPTPAPALELTAAIIPIAPAGPGGSGSVSGGGSVAGSGGGFAAADTRGAGTSSSSPGAVCSRCRRVARPGAS